MYSKRITFALFSMCCAALMGCSGLLNSENPDTAPLAVAFRTSDTGAAAKPVLSKPVTIQADNGTLVITDIRMIVDEFKLEGQAQGDDFRHGDDDDDDGRHDDDDDDDDHRNPRFKAPPRFLQLPLAQTESEAVVIREEVPAGTYTRLKFEVQPDGKNDKLAAEIHQTVPDWPDEASLMVAGTFTPANTDSAQSFRAFFKSEIEIKMTFDPPLIIAEDDPEKVVTITFDPARWFQNVNNTAIDLRQLDYDTTGHVFELDIELEEGFTKIEIDFDRD